MLDIPDVVGKLLFNCWRIQFELKHVLSITSEKAGLGMVVAAKKNI